MTDPFDDRTSTTEDLLKRSQWLRELVRRAIKRARFVTTASKELANSRAGLWDTGNGQQKNEKPDPARNGRH
jgi:hypothetical protein